MSPASAQYATAAGVRWPAEAAQPPHPAGAGTLPQPAGAARPPQPAGLTYAPDMPDAITIPMPALSTPSLPESDGQLLIRKLKPFVLMLGALAGLVYAGWAATARRSAFTGAADKSLDALKANDRLDSVLLVVCTILVVLAVGWMFVGWGRAIPTLRVAALACLGVGVVASAVAGYLLGTWEQDPGTASRGYLTLAIAFALAAVAFALELVASQLVISTADGRAKGSE